jgi:hypothetical protein
MPTAGEPRARMPPAVHVGRAAQVFDPAGVQHQEAIPHMHIWEGVTLSGVNAAGQRDVLFEFHGYIVQQVHSQRNYKGCFPVQKSNSGFYITLFQVLFDLTAEKKTPRAFYMNYTITSVEHTVITHNLLIPLSYYIITSCSHS